MTDKELLEMTKLNLQLITKQYDEYIATLIKAAKSYIKTKGITLDLTDIGDCNIVVMYAAYLYRARNYVAPTADTTNNNFFATTSNNAGEMPRMLKRAINNRLLSEKARKGMTS